MSEARYNILVVSDNSGRGQGGAEVFNQELAEALARRHNVTLFTANPDMPAHQGIQRTVQTQPPLMEPGPGAEGEPQPMERRDWLTHLAGQDPRQYGLEDPAAQPYDIIIGHSRFSGPAAAGLRENWYQDARLVHFLHTSPERLPFVRGLTPERAEAKAAKDSGIERGLMERSDVVAGVGPLLAQASRDLSAEGDHIPHSHEFVPGTKIYDPVQHDPEPDRLNLLVMGRVNDPLKGVQDAAEAVARLNAAGVPVHLTVRGVPEAEMEREGKLLRKLSGGNVTVKGRTSSVDELNEDIRAAHAMIMPSKHEGFGMVASEGLGHGVPVLVNEESGAALFLQDADRFPPEIGGACVVKEPTDGTSRAHAWMQAINQLRQDLPQRQAGALRIREILQQYSWEHAAEATVQAAMERTPLPRRDPRALVTAQERDLMRTVQGPDGRLLRPDAPEQASPATEGPEPGVGVQRAGPVREGRAPGAPAPIWQAGLPQNAQNTQSTQSTQDAPGGQSRQGAQLQAGAESARSAASPEQQTPLWQVGLPQHQGGTGSPRGTAPAESATPLWQVGVSQDPPAAGRDAGESGAGRSGGAQQPPPDLSGPRGGEIEV
ncbi:glycosyltransferase [Streptomyces sp. MNU76]|uniref:glycosyltransferase family 4 protein n=1 Tax=Streptomyces sp. MNU76 TaxID=2560026 RepID=UPI001E64E87F|nr:glycosyltransferase family 4 protein [Streptomyces sp. MNU76]MCC9706540.1 glycosyltransferase [Streptomyces sp. MNU76]